MAVLIAAILIAIVLILILLPPSRIIYIKLLSVPTLCVLFILCLILLSDSAVKAALNGLKLWAGIVVPSLFPFFVSAEIINSTGFIRAAGLFLDPVMRPVFNVPGCGSFALAMGVTSGYPVGAKITCDFRSSGDLTRVEAERLLAFTNNSGPLFIVGAVGTGIYGSSRIGLFLLLCHFLACISVGVLFRFYKRENIEIRRHSGRTSPEGKAVRGRAFRGNPFRTFARALLERSRSMENIGTIIGNSIRNAVSTILAIGGFIVLFSVVISLLNRTGILESAANVLSLSGIDKNVMKGILSGIFEITTGSSLVGNAPSVPYALRLPAASFIIGWAGLSVHFQVLSIASGTDVRIRPYLIGKLLQGILAAFYTWIGMVLLHPFPSVKEPVLGSMFTAAGWVSSFGSSLFTLFILLGVFLAFSFAASRVAPGIPYFRKKRR